MNGYAGKILRVNLTTKKISRINTADYAEWVGGHGMGSAIFWDLVPDKNINGFDIRNVITIMTSPLTGTLAPGGASRVEVQGIGVQQYPIGWFTRSNLGGRFGPMLKYAGWDGVVIEGKADAPVWVDVRNDDVHIRDARSLWGMDTWATQEKIWTMVAGGDFSGWMELGRDDSSGRTTQRPAVLTIGQAGENKSRLGALIHDAGNAAGQGGFGGIWGSKNLKAISVIGTGSVNVADPKGLLQARLWAKKNYGLDVSKSAVVKDSNSLLGGAQLRSVSSIGSYPTPIVYWQRPPRSRPQACMGCPSGCRARNESGLGNESSCIESGFYSRYDLERHTATEVSEALAKNETDTWGFGAFYEFIQKGKQTSAAYKVADLVQKYGINASEIGYGIRYLEALYRMGKLGVGKEIAADLPFNKLGEFEFAETLFKALAFRKGIGDVIAEGFVRAAKKWGRLEGDLKSGLLGSPYWGLPIHLDPRLDIEWGYGSILGDRDMNEHDFNAIYWSASFNIYNGKEPPLSAEKVASIYSSGMEPYQGDLSMLDFSERNIYSDSFVKLVAWHRRYSRFWKQSALYCDFLFPDFINPATKDKRGMLGKGEQKFLNAVTGKKYTFLDGIKLGAKIWNLDNAIWTLQGRNRNMVKFSDFVYDKPFNGVGYWPGVENGKWKYVNVKGRRIDRKKFEDWKTRYYKFEGWDTATGWPKRSALESMGLKKVADALQTAGRLGKG